MIKPKWPQSERFIKKITSLPGNSAAHVRFIMFGANAEQSVPAMQLHKILRAGRSR